MIAGRYDPAQFELLLPLTLTDPRTGYTLTIEVVPDGSVTVEAIA